MNSKILDDIQELFFLKLQEKTNWGRNDLKELYKDSVLQILKEYFNKQ